MGKPHMMATHPMPTPLSREGFAHLFLKLVFSEAVVMVSLRPQLVIFDFVAVISPGLRPFLRRTPTGSRPSSFAIMSICASLPARKALPWQPYIPRIPLFVNTL